MEKPEEGAEESVPSKSDIICAKGRAARDHPGNQRFRLIIENNKDKYRTAPTKDVKTRISRDILRSIKGCSGGGKFMKKAGEGKWVEIPDGAAREKISQALREAGSHERQTHRKKRAEPRSDGAAVARLLAVQQRFFREMLLDAEAEKKSSPSSQKEDRPARRRTHTGAPKTPHRPERSTGGEGETGEPQQKRRGTIA